MSQGREHFSGRAPSDPRPLLLERTTTWLVLGGCALGFWARLVDRVAPKWVGNVAALWFLAGFMAGRGGRGAPGGIRRGIVCLVAANLAYYGLRLAVDPISVGDLFPIPALWLCAGIVSGAVSGRLGELSHRHAHAWGIPAGVFVGEAVVVVVLRGRFVQAILELVAAAACLAMARARWPRAAALAAGTVPFVGWLAGLYRIVLR